MNRPNLNAQQRQELRQDRQVLRQDRQADRLDRMNERQNDRQTARDERFQLYNNEWWYWMPGNYWMYYRDNAWNRYDPDTFQPNRYSTGYRGDMDNNPRLYYDESGRQYRRDYSPLRRALRRAGEAAGQAAGIDINTPNVDVSTGGAANGTGPNVGVEIGGAAGTNRSP